MLQQEVRFVEEWTPFDRSESYTELNLTELRRLCRRVKLRVWTLVSLLVAAGATGALLPTLAYQCMTMAVRRDVERGSAQMLEMRTDLEDIRADMVYWRRRISSRTACVGSAANASIYAPDYEAIDRTIDDPPNDEAIRSLYYELT